MILLNQLKSLIINNAVDYKKIAIDTSHICKVSDTDRDVNLFIPVKGRLEFFNPCVNYIKRALKNSSLKVKIIVIENDIKLIYNKAVDNETDYLYIPPQDSRIKGLFEKSLCYNMGFIKAKRAKWNIFHDLDILVNNDFFQKLEIYFKKGPNWIQPYHKKRVLKLSPTITREITSNPNTDFRLDLPTNYTEPRLGSPGGSIVVKSDDFTNVGGYDPEIFWGYSPEDSFFWTKLELLHAKIENEMTTFFQGGATFADDPPIDVYHLDHPFQGDNNPYYGYMVDVLNSFWKFDYESRKEIIDMKKELLNKGFD